MTKKSDLRSAATYVPCLKVKGAELRAIASLSPMWTSVSDRLLPLFELAAPTDLSRRSAGEVHKAAVLIGRAWGQRPYFIDGSRIAGSEFPNGLNPFRYAIREGIRLGAMATPVLRLSSPAHHSTAVSEVLKEGGMAYGIALRLSQRELFVDRLEDHLVDFCRTIGVNPDNCDIIIDRGYIDSNAIAEATTAAPLIFKRLPRPTAWRSVTLLGGSFPDRLDGLVGPDETKPLDRSEWPVYRAIGAALGPTDRGPLFGDYAMVHPSEEIRGGGKGRPNLRYTVSDKYQVARGNMTEANSEQLPRLAKTLVEDSKVWCGKDFSPGDQFIHSLTRRDPEISNPQRWREAGFAHHFVFVVEQLLERR